MVKIRYSGLVFLVVVAGLFSGCEDDGRDPAREFFETTPVDDRWLAEEKLVVDPAEVSLAADGDQVVLTGSGGRGPYAWRVRDSSRGRIEVRGWSQALYTRTAPGSNSVILEDQSGHVALCHIEQDSDEDEP